MWGRARPQHNQLGAWCGGELCTATHQPPAHLTRLAELSSAQTRDSNSAAHQGSFTHSSPPFRVDSPLPICGDSPAHFPLIIYFQVLKRYFRHCTWPTNLEQWLQGRLTLQLTVRAKRGAFECAGFDGVGPRVAGSQPPSSASQSCLPASIFVLQVALGASGNQR